MVQPVQHRVILIRLIRLLIMASGRVQGKGGIGTESRFRRREKLHIAMVRVDDDERIVEPTQLGQDVDQAGDHEVGASREVEIACRRGPEALDRFALLIQQLLRMWDEPVIVDILTAGRPERFVGQDPVELSQIEVLPWVGAYERRRR